MKIQKNGDFELAPQGTFEARIITVADLGVQRSEWQGQGREAPKLGLTFELCTKRGASGQRLAVFDRVTASLHELSRLYQIAQAALGAAPEDGLDPQTLLGKPVLVTLVHRTSGTRTFANVAGVTAIPKEQETPGTDNPLLYFDLDNPDPAVFARLPALFKKLIEGRVRPPAEPKTSSDDPDDDISY